MEQSRNDARRPRDEDLEEMNSGREEIRMKTEFGAYKGAVVGSFDRVGEGVDGEGPQRPRLDMYV